MMPDLGKYAADVLTAYAFAGSMLVGIVALSLWQSRRARRKLEEAERR